MGRTKLKLAPLEVGPNRNATYSKRRQGLEKKVLELSILCDIDIMLLTFSPKGKPAFVKSSKSNPEEMIKRFAMLNPEERAKRKTESFEVIKKAFKDFPNLMDLEDPFGLRHHSREEYKDVEEMLQARLSKMDHCLSCWKHVDKIENIELLAHMQEILGKALFKIWNSKEIHKRQLLESIRNDRLKQLKLLAPKRDHAYQKLHLQGDFYESPHENTRCSKAIRLEGYPCIPKFSYIPTTTHREGTSNRINDERSSCTGYIHEHSNKIELPQARSGNDFLQDSTSRIHREDFVQSGNENGISGDPIGTEYDFSELIGIESKDIYFPDVMEYREEGYSPLGIINETRILTGTCPAGGEHNTSMVLNQNTDYLDMFMNLPETTQEDVFPEELVETSNKFKDMTPTSVIQNDNVQYTTADNCEVANEDNIFEAIFKDIEEDYYHTDEAGNQNDLDITHYTQIPDHSFSSPFVCDTVQPGVINAEKYAQICSTNDFPEFDQSKSSLTSLTWLSTPRNSRISVSGEYLSPQSINSFDDQKAAYYSEHNNLLPFEFRGSLN